MIPIFFKNFKLQNFIFTNIVLQTKIEIYRNAILCNINLITYFYILYVVYIINILSSSIKH